MAKKEKDVYGDAQIERYSRHTKDALCLLPLSHESYTPIYLTCNKHSKDSQHHLPFAIRPIRKSAFRSAPAATLQLRLRTCRTRQITLWRFLTCMTPRAKRTSTRYLPVAALRDITSSIPTQNTIKKAALFRGYKQWRPRSLSDRTRKHDMPGGFSRLVNGARKHLGDNLNPEDGYLLVFERSLTVIDHDVRCEYALPYILPRAYMSICRD
jgi:hypothetical protein